MTTILSTIIACGDEMSPADQMAAKMFDDLVAHHGIDANLIRDWQDHFGNQDGFATLLLHLRDDNYLDDGEIAELVSSDSGFKDKGLKVFQGDWYLQGVRSALTDDDVREFQIRPVAVTDGKTPQTLNVGNASLMLYQRTDTEMQDQVVLMKDLKHAGIVFATRVDPRRPNELLIYVSDLKPVQQIAYDRLRRENPELIGMTPEVLAAQPYPDGFLSNIVLSFKSSTGLTYYCAHVYSHADGAPHLVLTAPESNRLEFYSVLKQISLAYGGTPDEHFVYDQDRMIVHIAVPGMPSQVELAAKVRDYYSGNFHEVTIRSVEYERVPPEFQKNK